MNQPQETLRAPTAPTIIEDIPPGLCLVVLENRMHGRPIGVVGRGEIDQAAEATVDMYDTDGRVTRVLRCWHKCGALSEIEETSGDTYEVHRVTPSARSSASCPIYRSNQIHNAR